jgi:integrase
VYFGRDYASAMAGYAAWCRSRGDVDTVGWLLDLFTTTVCSGYVKAGKLKPRTMRDYQRDAIVLKKGLGHIPLSALRPKHVVTYRDTRAQDAPGHVRNELACLSAAMSYAVESGRTPSNPCLQVSRPRRRRRLRLVTDDEYLTVYARATESVKIAMTLAIRTLALPADVLAMGPRNIVKLPDGTRILRYQRAKTGTLVEIEVIGDLARVVDEHAVSSVVRPTFVHTENGDSYTVDGIGAMFRRYCVGTREKPTKPIVDDFGLRDLRAKGATDEYRAGRGIRSLQRLLGHRSIQTTEIYIKSLVPETVRPNGRPIVAKAT